MLSSPLKKRAVRLGDWGGDITERRRLCGALAGTPGESAAAQTASARSEEARRGLLLLHHHFCFSLPLGSADGGKAG